MLRSIWAYFCVLLFAFVFISANAQFQKRSAMGGSAFGSLDRIPISILTKFYGRQKQEKRDPFEFDKYMGFRDYN